MPILQMQKLRLREINNSQGLHPAQNPNSKAFCAFSSTTNDNAKAWTGQDLLQTGESASQGDGGSNPKVADWHSTYSANN